MNMRKKAEKEGLKKIVPVVHDKTNAAFLTHFPDGTTFDVASVKLHYPTVTSGGRCEVPEF